jgi:hypothetical protein
MAAHVNVYLECGAKRTFAGALDWPGWCRYGSNEAEALEALLAYGPKYASILAGTGLGFTAPKDLAQLTVVERLHGTAGTDFGVISVTPKVDADRSCDAVELKRFEKILRAGWRAFDRTVESARGRALSTGPRGGGRSLEGIVAHVIEADAGYLAAVGWNAPKARRPKQQMAANRQAIVAALKASGAREIPERGPRGGRRWTARFFARRVTWHVIGHAWEIERRLASAPRQAHEARGLGR